MNFGQKRRPRVRLRSSFGHLCFLTKSADRGSVFGVLAVTYFLGAKAEVFGSGFGVVYLTYEFWPNAQAAGQSSE